MDRKTWLTFLAVIGVMLIAAGFRFYDITNYPPGLFPDQAANGEDVRLILDGDVRPFYPRGNGREALFFFIQAAFVKTFGIGVWPMFAASAAVGTATVLATFFATRVYFGRLAGLVAALLLATNHWHVTLSRTGFRAILIPLCLALVTAFVGYCMTATAKKQWWQAYVCAALAGAAFASGFYTYIAYRIMIAVVLGMIVIMLVAALHPKIGFPHLRRYRWQAALAVATGLIVIAPLALFFWQHPADFIGRAGQVSVFNPDLQRQYGGGRLLPTIAYSLRETLQSFFTGDGDRNWRHNVAGYPLLNPLVGILFLLGLAWCINGTVRLAYTIFKGQELHRSLIYPYLLLLLGGMIVPVITTVEGIPHGLRSIGLVFPIFFLAGTAASVCIYWIKRRYIGRTRALLYGSVIGLLAVGMLYDGALYFGIARHDSEAYAAYRGDLTRVAAFIEAHHQAEPTALRPLLVLDGFSMQTIHYLTSVAAHDHVVGAAVHPDEAAHHWIAVEPGVASATFAQDGQLIIFTQSTIGEADAYARAHRNIELVTQAYNQWGQEIMRVYRGTASEPDKIDGLDA